MQTETSLSTMEAEVVALAHSCRELFPIVDMDEYLSGEVGLAVVHTTMIFSIREDNHGALVLVDTLPPQFSPLRKYYYSNNIWF